MGLSSALYSAISGLQSNAQAMTVTGNNISNSNTTGFKGSSTVFSDLLSANIASTSGNSQVGRGSQVQTVETNFSQGGFESTENATDLAIQGSGFFIVHSPTDNTNLYTRNGNFKFDDNGFLVNADGYKVQGSLFNSSGILASGTLSDIHVDMVTQLGAKQTENVNLTTNLDADSKVLAGFSLTDPQNTSNYATTTTVYDSLGTAHDINCYFAKTGDQQWSWYAVTDAGDLGGTAGTLQQVGTGALGFDEDGNLTSGDTLTLPTITWSDGATPQSIKYTFKTTQFNSASTVFSQDQDGYTSGNVTKVDISTDGTVTAVYSNGETIDVGLIGLASFVNPDGLDSVGSSLFRQTSNSGTPSLGYPGGGLGSLLTKSLELSNVDLATEFVDLITIQNGYSANSKVITTTNDMLQELLNLKR